MAAISWPTSGRAFAAAQYDEGLEWDVEIVTFRNGRASTVSLPGARWVAQLSMPDDTVAYLADRRQLEALIDTLKGGAVRLNVWNLLTPKPLGTLQTGTPQVASTMAAGATSVAMKNCSGTLLRGDRFQLGATGQRVKVTADATPSSGNMTVSFQPAARLAASVDLAIVYDKPYTQFILTDPRILWPHRMDKLPAVSVALVEGYE